MRHRYFALLIHNRSFPFESLKSALKELGVETSSVETIKDAKRLVPQTEPHLVFTDTTLPDGSWPDVVSLAEESGVPTNVIVVSSHKDIKLYLTALERGAYDFVLPPFEHESIDFVVQGAAENARQRRFAQSRATV